VDPQEYAALAAYTDERSDAMVAALADLVGQESPSTDKQALDALAGLLAERWRDAGAEVQILADPTAGNHVRASVPGRAVSEAGPQAVLLLGHYDTVWPVGTLARRPFRVDGERALGPGVCDMKSGLVIAEFALRAIAALDLPLRRPVVMLMNSDEEVGSHTSRAQIESAAREAACVLVLEPSIPGGALKTARKGVGSFRLEVRGRAAHAGVAPQEGVSAIEELARQILKLHAMTNLDVGTTVNVGVIEGGTRSNVVAARATAQIDVRAWTRAEATRIGAAIHALKPFNPSAAISVRGGFGRFPMERTQGTVKLFETAQRVGQSLGIPLSEGSSGGGSDGNFTAAIGVPTLDGLGAVGDGSHAEHEYIELASLPARAALLAGLLCEL